MQLISIMNFFLDKFCQSHLFWLSIRFWKYKANRPLAKIKIDSVFLINKL